MDELHLRLLRIGFNAGSDLGLVLAGGYALSAHELTTRPSRDIDFATATAMPLPAVAERLAQAYVAAGLAVRIIETTPRMARLVVYTEATECEVDLLKEAIGPPAQLSIGPVLAFGDAVGLKVRALHERAAHRDYIDICAANSRLSWHELESLGAQHTNGFSLEELADRLGGIRELDHETFMSYRLSESDVEALCRWAFAWAADIRSRLASGEAGPIGLVEDEWDAYLDPPDARATR
ncbi:nucleotidyl transferase AbiEii/AbiGii toxin family protein [Micromonospora sp. WMMD1082]|uniref:nucleotidyl transferase AbiEii/AbiGii toxin family protein n=1 Tax=Micromonospora sp. WMMD1082 TaxID=3016104 RepID=UPI002417F3C8|nr:nucleotidyl transferase AbiEii/AbiGii toxin family protein [Micromonospora sp. WMMD1082]MDG4793243.1 nucleotidyl transferase AbiEii/AbiGii toxin family protein [Micromonospora sp. WMMD1082]